MGKTIDNPAELAIDGAAAAILAGSIAFAALKLGLAPALPVALFAFALVFAALRRVPAAERSLPLASFAAAPFEALGAWPGDDELLLDDVLVQPEPDSRVVQLFDPMPTARDLHTRIDRHPRSGPDASQALSDALRELRRSLG